MDHIYFVPLGGAGEIGMNLNLYGYRGKWIMVDLGITFGDESTPGIDVIMPDPVFIEDMKEDLLGVVLTHAHEDHIGAIPYLWERFGCPIYATPFTASMVKHKLRDAHIKGVKINEIPLKGRFKLDPFDLEYITLTHSIPEPNALMIRTDSGNIFHTGDWKIDPDPIVGETTDFETLKKIGEEGVLALVGDSTNSLYEGGSDSEADVEKTLLEIVKKEKNRVVVTCFASNVARLKALINVAAKTKRKIVLAGKSLRRITEIAQKHGILDKDILIFEEKDYKNIPRSETLLICTGSQGEYRAALAKIAQGAHPRVYLEKEDTVIFSSRVIPGNEKKIYALQNKLLSKGISLITDNEDLVHVSGHPPKDDLIQMFQHIKPQTVIPVHGERIHQQAHAKIANSCQISDTLIVENGDLVEVSKDGVEIIEKIESGRLGLDGNQLIPMDDPLVRKRKKILWNGLIIVTLVVDEHDNLRAAPQIVAPGFFDLERHEEIIIEMIDACESEFYKLDFKSRNNDTILSQQIRTVIRRVLKFNGYDVRNKKTVIDIQIICV